MIDFNDMPAERVYALIAHGKFSITYAALNTEKKILADVAEASMARYQKIIKMMGAHFDRAPFESPADQINNLRDELVIIGKCCACIESLALQCQELKKDAGLP